MELGERIGVEARLVRTWWEQPVRRDRHRRGVRQGGNEYNQFTRRTSPIPCLRPIREAPYFAVAVYPSTMGTCVGLSTDGDARVLDGEGRAIGSLYAVGNDMASLFRGVYVGPGITLRPALVFAYRAVMHMARG